MAKKFYKKGAEAELSQETFEGEKALSKKRVPKGYRNSVLDNEIRGKRTRGEAKLLREAGKVVRTPRIFFVDEKKGEIMMEFVEGKTLKEVVEEKKELCAEAGKEIRKLHDAGIIHGDLTTSNILLSSCKKEKQKSQLVFIDFGLGFFSNSLEDKGTDLVVFKKTFNATHSSLKNGWEIVMKGYGPNKEIEERMKAIEKRARYH